MGRTQQRRPDLSQSAAGFFYRPQSVFGHDEAMFYHQRAQDIRERAARGESQRSIGRLWGISQTRVGQILQAGRDDGRRGQCDG